MQQRAVELDKQITELSDEISNKIPELSEQQKLLNEFIDEDFSTSIKLDADGEIVPELVTARQLVNDIENDQAIMNRLRDCV